MENTPITPNQNTEARWLHRGIGLVLGLTIVLAFKTLGVEAGAAFAITFMGALLVFSRVF